MSLIKPQQIDAERALISCILDMPDLFYNVILRPEVFFGMDNAIVYQTITEIFSAGRKPDVVLLSSELSNKDQFDMVGGKSYFENLASVDHTSSNFAEYTKLVTNAYVLRCVIDAGKKIVDAGYSGTANDAVDLAFSETSKLIDAANFGFDVLEVRDLVSKEFVALLERMKSPGGEGLPTGLSAYDSLMSGGLSKSDEVIIAARPSVGKTALSLRFMLNLAKRGIPTLFFSYEMSQKQLMQRLFAMESGVSLGRIRNGKVSTHEFGLVSQAVNTIGGLPIYINNNYSAPVAEVVSKTQKLVRDKGVEVAIVDYIQLMPFRIKYATLDLGNIARRLKGLAMNADVSLVLISQLNRLIELRQNKVPLLADLRQSGNLEEHADVVVMLHRQSIYEPTVADPMRTELFIRKNRNGPVGVVSLDFNAASVDFTERAWQ